MMLLYKGGGMFHKLKSLSLVKKLGLGFAAFVVLSMVGDAAQPYKANLTVSNTDSTRVLGSETAKEAAQPKAHVDCAGGSGNGPYYVTGPVTVTGTDHYGLDGDHNGMACQ